MARVHYEQGCVRVMIKNLKRPRGAGFQLDRSGLVPKIDVTRLDDQFIHVALLPNIDLPITNSRVQPQVAVTGVRTNYQSVCFT